MSGKPVVNHHRGARKTTELNDVIGHPPLERVVRLAASSTAVLSCLLALVLFLAACAPTTSATSEQAKSKAITVAAASDLQLAFTEIGRLFEQETGRKVVFNFGSTGTLARQIENGAPIDVFAAANARYVDELAAKDLIVEDTQRLYAIGRIVLAVNTQTGLDLLRLEDLARPEVKRIAIANPAHAPYGTAAKEALVHEGLWDEVSPRLVIGENISQAMQFVKTGNAEAGLIALSVANMPEVSHTLVPEDKHNRLNQAMAVVRGSKHEDAARNFLRFVQTPEATQVLKRYGFGIPGEM